MDGKLSQSTKSRAAAIAGRAGWMASGMLMVGVCLLYRWYSPSDSAVAKPPASAVKN